MNGAEPRGPKSTTVRLFQVDPRWYEHHWLSDPASRRRNAFAYFRRILSDCPKWWGHCREALAAVGRRQLGHHKCRRCMPIGLEIPPLRADQ
jgi:hypothetical protein